MTAMTLDEARLVDPVLTTHARGFKHPDRVGHLLFPTAETPARGLKRLEFNRDSFKRYATARAPGAATRRVQFGYEGKIVSLDQQSLEGVVPFEHMEEAANGPSLDLRREAVNGVLDIITLAREVAQANLATDAAQYPVDHVQSLSGTDQWSDSASDPKAVIAAARETIRKSIGVRPNTLVLSPGAYNALEDHPLIVEKFKFSSAESVTQDMMARYFGVETLAVGDAVEADDAGVFQDVWGNNAVLAYVPGHDEQSMRTPAYGYTYQLRGYPAVEVPYTDRNAKSWIVPVTDEASAELVGPDAGFLLQNVVAAV